MRRHMKNNYERNYRICNIRSLIEHTNGFLKTEIYLIISDYLNNKDQQDALFFLNLFQ